MVDSFRFTSIRVPISRLLFIGALLAACGMPAVAGPSTAISDGGPEAALEAIFLDIENNRLDSALTRTETLLKYYPNFRLGHLIKGDLLLSHAGALKRFGNVDGASRENLDGLRAEAIARLRGYRDRPKTNSVPRYLLEMSPGQAYAVVVDTKRSRLYVYRNDKGKPRFVADYYVTHGKAGSDKWREGDKRTPIGVYHVTSAIPGDKLADLYGSGAFPLNYPNEWDKREKRTGHGIWLHGTQSDTYSRPPLASDGCVVLANQDFNALSNYVTPGETPVIISDQVEWLSLDSWQAERSALNKAIESWRRDWESRDTDRYLTHYASSFHSDQQDRTAWAKSKRQINASKDWVKVRLNELSMFRNPGSEEMVVVTFRQDYQSNNLNDSLRKRQYWIKEQGQWKIAYEGPA